MKKLTHIVATVTEGVLPPENAHKPFWCSILGVKTFISYWQLAKALEKDEGSELRSTRQAFDKFCSDKFSCTYGRRGDAQFRKFIKSINEKGVVSQDELRLLIVSGDLRPHLGRVAYVSSPIVSGVIAVLNIILSTSCFLWALLMLLLAPTDVLEMIWAPVSFFLLFWLVTYRTYLASLRSFFLLRRKKTTLSFWVSILCAKKIALS